LFIGAAIGNVSIETLIGEVIPFILVEFAVLLAITYIPAFSLTVPRFFGF
jgi:TRAP-type C4-dicarboxylate transport system permease large subunit